MVVSGATAGVVKGIKAIATKAPKAITVADDVVKVADDIIYPAEISFDPKIPQHLATIDGFTQSKGLIGTHNTDAFYQAVDEYGLKILETTEISPGISEIKYTYPTFVRDGSIDRDAAGEIIYNNIPPKTIYDPKIYSDAKILELGQEAATKGYADAVKNNLTQYNAQAGGVKFHFYINPITKNIRNFFSTK